MKENITDGCRYHHRDHVWNLRRLLGGFVGQGSIW